MTISDVRSLAQALKKQAAQLGFVLCGVAPAAAPGRLESLYRWLDAGYAGQMHYVQNRRAAYAHPRHVLEGCRTVVMLALPYGTSPLPEKKTRADPIGRVARYAQGEVDYHDIVHAKLKRLSDWLLSQRPQAAVRGVVDTAPLLERELAEAAGLGWVGKNTLLLNRQWGSYFFLAALLSDLDLPSDPPQDHGYCGTCTACLDACPTAAFPEPYVLDARRCISYLTIEHRLAIAPELCDQLDGWVFGCDICQQVCPWNRKARNEHETVFDPREDLHELDLQSVLQLTEDDFRQRFRSTPLWRAKRRGLLRNAILVVGSSRHAELYSHVCRLLDDEEPLVRGAAAWAIGQFHRKDASVRLRARLAVECDPAVVQSLEQACRTQSPSASGPI